MHLLNFLPLALGLVHAAAGAPDASKLPPLLDATLDQLRNGLDEGLFTSVDLVKAYLSRIIEVNPKLNTMIEVNPDAVSIAQELDDKLKKDGKPLSPLHGIPVVIKAAIGTDDKMNTTAGSFALQGSRVPEDSGIVQRLRKAGAIILGKTNMSQWSNLRSSQQPNGWTSIGGQSFAAYVEDQSPSGSSGGSGVAASLGLAWAAVGTDSTGSVVMPAAANNIVGIKPSVGLTSRYLVVPYSKEYDTVGPMTRTVKDTAHLLAAMAGPDPQDEATNDIPDGGKVPDYVAACQSEGLKGKRVGVPSIEQLERLSYINETNSEASREAFDKALQVLKDAGAELVNDIPLPGVDVFETSDGFEEVFRVVFAGLDEVMRGYLSKLTVNPNNITSVRDIVNFTKNDKREKFPEVPVDTFEDALAFPFNTSSQQYKDLLAQIRFVAGEQGITGAIKNNSLDAIVAPGAFFVNSASVLGSPVITVPLGGASEKAVVRFDRSSGKLKESAPNHPFGLSFAGPRFSEETLIGMAFAFEERTQARTKIKPIIEVKTEIADILEKKEKGRSPLAAMTPRFHVKRIAIIGAGPSGLIAAKYLLAQQAFDEIVIFEQQHEIGGIWVPSPAVPKCLVPQTDPFLPPEEPVDSPEDRSRAACFPSAIYHDLRANIVGPLMQFSDEPFPSSCRVFPSCDDIRTCIRRYGADVKHLVRFSLQVVRLELLHGDRWRLRVRHVESGDVTDHVFDAVVVASGHYSLPFIPDISNIAAFHHVHPSVILHSRQYRHPDSFRDKKVVVVGNGPSGIDISSQINAVSKGQTLLSVRSVTSADKLAFSGCDEVPEIVDFLVDERGVRFKDGRIETDVDAIVFCTGFLFSYPFLTDIQSKLITNGRGVHGLYKHLFYAQHPTLVFPSLLMRSVPWPVSEVQAAAFATVWSNKLELPQADEMQAWSRDLYSRVGDALHTLPPGGNCQYINEMHDWVVKASYLGKEPPRWSDFCGWQHLHMHEARRRFQEQGYQAMTWKDLGLEDGSN
ncbi:hypothetical protein CP533_2677 [Ophiocordyceps camponoti-saundersi (nom. inval.)]|nr:hypothetical protein CP533_2677 [Ophiocordyceps camponoti-saundersi (nom. inval.)]